MSYAPVTIRHAKEDDQVRIVRLLQDWIDSASLDLPPPIEEDLAVWVGMVLTTGWVLVAEKSGRLVGVVGLQSNAAPWNVTHEFIQSVFFYVPKAHHKTGVSEALSDGARALAGAHERPLVLSVIGNTNSPAATVSAYKTQGFLYSGSTLTAGYELRS